MRSKPLTGRTVLAWLVGFFTVVAGANLVLVKLALDTLPGTEVESAYRASLGFNAETAASRAQALRHWHVAAHVQRDADNRASVRIEARDAGDAPLAGIAFSVRLARPTDKRADRLVALAERGGGVYGGEAADVPPGQWDLIIEAERGAERVFLSRNRVVLR